jgi:ATP-dependent Clp protease ATP-binding subunit ClpC
VLDLVLQLKAAKATFSQGVIENALRKAFAPEFLNRIDDVVIFDSLHREDIHKIIDIELEHLFSRVREMGYKLELTPEAKDFIAEKGWDEQFGARPLKRAIQKYVEDPLAEEIIRTKLHLGDQIVLGYNKETSDITIEVKRTQETISESQA